MVTADNQDEEIQKVALKGVKVPVCIEEQKLEKIVAKHRCFVLTLTVLLFITAFLAASTVILYCYCQSLSHRLEVIEKRLQSLDEDGFRQKAVQSPDSVALEDSRKVSVWLLLASNEVYSKIKSSLIKEI